MDACAYTTGMVLEVQGSSYFTPLRIEKAVGMQGVTESTQKLVKENEQESGCHL